MYLTSELLLFSDIPPTISSFYRSNFTKFWIETLPNRMKEFKVDPLYEYHPSPNLVTHTSSKPKPAIRNPGVI